MKVQSDHTWRSSNATTATRDFNQTGISEIITRTDPRRVQVGA